MKRKQGSLENPLDKPQPSPQRPQYKKGQTGKHSFIFLFATMTTEIAKQSCRMNLRIGISSYCILWALAALFGLPDVDRKFGVESAVGTRGIAPGGKRLEIVPVVRIPFSTELRGRGIIHGNVLDGPWRARSTGYAIAPFLVIDDIAYQTDALAGLSGPRFVFWL